MANGDTRKEPTIDTSAEDNGPIDAVAQELSTELAAPVQTPAPDYPQEGIDLAMPFQLISDKLSAARRHLLSMLTSNTDRSFAEQRRALHEFQAMLRAYDVLAGFVTPSGHIVADYPLPSADFERARGEYINKHTESLDKSMAERSKQFSNVPLDPIRPQNGDRSYVPPRHRGDTQPDNGAKPPNFIQRLGSRGK